jgi:DNA polymerase elongation subunit (family B)
MEYDKGFKTYLTVAKKRYAGVLDYLDGHEIKDFNMYIAGLEYKRTDVTKIVKELQWNLLKTLLENEETPEIEAIRSTILAAKDQAFSGKLLAEDISLSQKLTKEMDSYDGRQMHVLVAKEMQADGKEVWIGDKIPYFIIGLDANKKPIPKPLYKFEGKYCESYYWNNKIFPPLQRILEVVYPNIDWESYKEKGSGEVKTGRTNLW